MLEVERCVSVSFGRGAPQLLEDNMGITKSEIYKTEDNQEKPKQEMEHHDKYPPSSFPALKECPCFLNSGTGSKEASRGHKIHEQMSKILENHNKTK